MGKLLLWSFALLFLLTTLPATAQGIDTVLARQAQQDAELARLGFGSGTPAAETSPPAPRPPAFVPVRDLEKGTLYEDYSPGVHGAYDSQGNPVYSHGPGMLGPGDGAPNSNGGITNSTGGTLPGGPVCPVP